MSILVLKTILAVILLISGVAAALLMLAVMGRVERKADPVRLRKAHRAMGYVFAVFLLALAVLGVRIFVTAGETLSLRAVLHAFLALSLLFIFLLKISLVRYYRQFLRLAPVLGMTVLVLILLVFSVSAGYFLLRTSFGLAAVLPGPAAVQLEGNSERGLALFARHCASCHHTDKEEPKVGPGLKGILAGESLPVSGRPANEENVRRQLIRPLRSMPSFASLTQQELADLIAYLKNL
ncbi:MAG: DUF6529 family protein [Acidobacteriota bacterium]